LAFLLGVAAAPSAADEDALRFTMGGGGESEGDDDGACDVGAVSGRFGIVSLAAMLGRDVDPVGEDADMDWRSGL
jgi:hypothetical protein